MLEHTYPPEPHGPLHPLSRSSRKPRSTLSKYSRSKSRTHRFLLSRDNRAKRKRGANWRYVLYQFSFSILIVLLAVLLTVSAYGIGEQAFRVGGQRRWNIVVLSAAYFAIVSPLPGSSRESSNADVGLASVISPRIFLVVMSCDD